MHRRNITVLINQNHKQLIELNQASFNQNILLTKVENLNTNPSIHEEVNQNMQKLCMSKQINIDLENGNIFYEEIKQFFIRIFWPYNFSLVIKLLIVRIKSIPQTERLRENFDFNSYLNDKNKLKNLKAKIKDLKHQTLHTKIYNSIEILDLNNQNKY